MKNDEQGTKLLVHIIHHSSFIATLVDISHLASTIASGQAFSLKMWSTGASLTLRVSLSIEKTTH
jgi:hypothetical protein